MFGLEQIKEMNKTYVTIPEELYEQVLEVLHQSEYRRVQGLAKVLERCTTKSKGL